MGQASVGPHISAVRALVSTLAVQSPHVCDLQEKGSPHWLAQQGMAFFKASSRPGAPFPLQKTVNVRNRQLGENFPSDMAV